MIFWVDDQLFEKGACDVDRIALLRGAAKRRHTLIVSANPWDTPITRRSPHFDHWRTGLPERLRNEVDLLRQHLDIVSANTTTRGAERMLVTLQEWPQGEDRSITLDEAIRAAVLPTNILVEHLVNDRAFLRRAMPPEWRERLDKWERDGLLRYEHGGGATTKDIVKHYSVDNTVRQTFGLPTRVWRRVHVVICDHDGEDVATPGVNIADLQKVCDDAGLTGRHHILRRKDQEHYLPREAMDAIVEKHRALTSAHERHQLEVNIRQHFEQGDARHFKPVPTVPSNKRLFKNAFAKYENDLGWQDEWFVDVWPEMTMIAEMIAAAI